MESLPMSMLDDSIVEAARRCVESHRALFAHLGEEAAYRTDVLLERHRDQYSSQPRPLSQSTNRAGAGDRSPDLSASQESQPVPHLSDRSSDAPTLMGL